MNKLGWFILFATLLSHAAAAEPKPGEAAAALAAIKNDWKKAVRDYEIASDKAKTAEDRKLLSAKAPNRTAFADRYLKLADAHPGTREELSALCWASLNAPTSDAGKKATASLTGGRIEQAAPDELVLAFQSARTQFKQDTRPLVPAILARAKKTLDQPQAPRLLAWVCTAYMGDDSDKPPELFTEAADLIVAKFADNPDISHFCESLFLNGGPPWASRFERHLRTIAETNKTPSVQATSRYGVASVVRGKGVDGQGEAEKLYQQFVKDYEGDSKQPLRRQLVGWARQELNEIKQSGLGKPAKEIAGEDLDGKPIKLSDHKGKVVLLVFWASWCSPCLADIPHEKVLVEKFKERPFVLLGVYGDEDKSEANQVVERFRIPWRSVWNGPKGSDGPIADAWAVGGWPTVYVIDHLGVIRENRLRGKRLDAPLEALVAAADKALRKQD